MNAAPGFTVPVRESRSSDDHDAAQPHNEPQALREFVELRDWLGLAIASLYVDHKADSAYAVTVICHMITCNPVSVELPALESRPDTRQSWPARAGINADCC
jgi:hypothetical protein